MKEWLKAVVGGICIAIPIVIAAKPVAVGSEGDVSITLHDDKCALKVQLPAKAVWREGKREYQGCWGIQGGIVVMFFDDNSIAILPTSAFKALTSL